MKNIRFGRCGRLSQFSVPLPINCSSPGLGMLPSTTNYLKGQSDISHYCYWKIMASPPRGTTKPHDTGLTLLDRRIPIVLAYPDETASKNDSVSPATERLHRLHGTSIIFDVAKLLNLSASTYATACTIFHRFYQQASLAEHDVWSVALASIMLATKVEEEAQILKTIIHAFCHVYRKRVLVADTKSVDTMEGWDWNHPCLRHVVLAKSWSFEQKEQFLATFPLPSKLGPVFEEWHKQALHAEAMLLRQLGFTLYWIPDSHPHKFILYFCQALDLTQPRVRNLWWQLLYEKRINRVVKTKFLIIFSFSPFEVYTASLEVLQWFLSSGSMRPISGGNCGKFSSLDRTFYFRVSQWHLLQCWILTNKTLPLPYVCMLYLYANTTRQLVLFCYPPETFRWNYPWTHNHGGKLLWGRTCLKKLLQLPIPFEGYVLVIEPMWIQAMGRFRSMLWLLPRDM